MIAFVAYILAGLSIFQLLNPAIEILDSTSFQLGETRISILRLLKTLFLGAILFWVAGSLSRFLDDKVHQASDLTGIAIISGALSVRIGFGLQTVVSNLVSGFILLLDRSIKPGDVIEIESTYGVIKNLGARYVSLLTRDGTENLIPNEMLIKDKVVNWSFSNSNICIKAPIGIAYGCDPHKAIKLCMAAARSVPRVLQNLAPNCLLREFGENSVNQELRFWTHTRAWQILQVLFC